MILTYKSLSIQMKIFIEESLLSGLSGQLPEVLAYILLHQGVCLEQSTYMYVSCRQIFQRSSNDIC